MRYSGQNALKLMQWVPDPYAAGAQPQLANGTFMHSQALLDSGDGLPNLAASLKEPQQKNRVREKAYVNGTLHRVSDHPVLRQNQYCEYTLISQIHKQFMHLYQQEAFARH